MVHQWGFFVSISTIRNIWSLTANSRSLQAAALKLPALGRKVDSRKFIPASQPGDINAVL